MSKGRKKQYLFVDGYNIIFAWNELKNLANESLEEARLMLLNMLSDYQGASGLELIAVFDAHMVKDNIGLTEVFNGNITVVFTKEFETADEYIEKTVSGLAKKNKVMVATSDSLEQIMVIGRGAERISANDLFLRIKESKKEQKTKYIDKKPIKSNMLLDNLNPELKAQLEKMRRQKE